MVTIVDASCKVAELPQRPLRRVAVSLSQKCETILLRVLSAAEGVVGPCPRKTSRRKLKVRDLKKNLRCVPERWPQSAANQRVKSSASSARGLPKSATRATDGQPTPATHRERARAAETAGEAHDAKQTMSTTGPPKKLTLIR